MKPLLALLLTLLIVQTMGCSNTSEVIKSTDTPNKTETELTANTEHSNANIAGCVGHNTKACSLLTSDDKCADYYIIDPIDCQARYCGGANNQCEPKGKHCKPKNCKQQPMIP